MILLALLAATPAYAAPVTGTVTQSLSGMPTSNAPYTIVHSLGIIEAACGDGTQVVADLHYSLDGLPQAQLQAIAANIHVTVSGNNPGATVTVQVPSEYADVPTKSLTLNVTLPRNTTLDVQGGLGRNTVTGCHGTAKVHNTVGPIGVDGVYTGVDIVAMSGPISATLGAATLTAASQIVSQSANITVQMPDLAAKISATFANITVQMPDLVISSQTSTTLVGINKSGTVLLTITTPQATLSLH